MVTLQNMGSKTTPDGRSMKPFERIKVKSRDAHTHRGETIVDGGGDAEVCMMPHGHLYLMGVGSRVCVKADARPGIDFDWIE